MTGNRPYRAIRPKRVSLKKHAGLCLLTLIAFPVTAAALVHFAGDARDAYSGGLTTVAPIALSKPANDLNADVNAGLPDILPQNETAQSTMTPPKVDILGNGAPAAQNGLAGDIEPPAPTVNSGRPTGTPPVRATIDGKPIEDIPGRPDTRSPVPGRFIPQVTASTPLPAAPLPGLSRATPFGPVPTKGPGGRSALTSYAKPFTAPTQGKTVSLIIGGLGINASQTRRAINDLPPQITLSFASQATGLQNWINQARAKGHEVILELPMEPYNFDRNNASARYTLLSDNSPAANVRNLDCALERSGSPSRPALGIGFSYPATIDAVEAWSKDAQSRGITLAPASYALMQGR